MRTRKDRLVAVATLGAFVVVAGVLGLVSLYLGAVTQALSGVQRGAPLPDYPGRPSHSSSLEGRAPVRYLVLVTADDGSLASAYLAQLSSGRDALHLIGLPANLLVEDIAGGPATLGGAFNTGGAQAVRAVESLLGLRVDHLLQVHLKGFARVIDLVGGVSVPNRGEVSAEGWHFPAGKLRLSSADAAIYVSANKQPMTRLERTEAVLVEILRGVVGGDALTNPAKVETLGEVLHECLTVDAALTPGEIRRMTLDVHLSTESIDGAPLPLAGLSELNGVGVAVVDSGGLARLVRALADDQVASWLRGQSDPWKPLAALPPR